MVYGDYSLKNRQYKFKPFQVKQLIETEIGYKEQTAIRNMVYCTGHRRVYQQSKKAYQWMKKNGYGKHWKRAIEAILEAIEERERTETT